MRKTLLNKKTALFGTILVLALVVLAWGSGVCRTDKAVLNIVSEPEGAKVTVDTGEKGNTPCTLEVTPGKRRLKIKKRAHIAAQLDVEIKAMETKEIKVTLTPIPTT